MKAYIFYFFLYVYLAIPNDFLIGKDQKASQFENPKVLLLGNSLTGAAIPEDLFGLVKASNKNLNIDKIIAPGRSLLEISESDNFINKIAVETFDFIVMQDSPYRIAYPVSFPTFPTSKAIENIINEVSDSGTMFILFMPYAYKDGMQWYMNFTDDFFQMQEKIYNYTLQLADNNNLYIAPVGWAWYNVMLEGSTIDLYQDDLSHPSSEGSYLSACVIYSSIYNEEIDNTNYVSNLNPNVASYLQTIASTTVMSDLEQWNYLSIENDEGNSIEPFYLNQNFPNPFNPFTNISFNLLEQSDVTINITDINGAIVRNILKNTYDIGSHNITWDGTDEYGNQVSTGIYIYTLRTNNYSKSKKMILLR